MAEEQLVGRYEMLWDCEYCGTQGLLGLTHRHCPECGAVQDPERRYYPDDEHKVAVDDHRYSGTDQICASCGAASSAAASHCGNCGAALDDAAGAVQRREQTEGAGGGFDRDSVERGRQERDGSVASPPPKKSRTWMIVVGVVVAVVAVILVVVLWRATAQLTVAGVEWRRSIAIETMSDVRESDWRDRVPRDARGVSCRREKRSTKKVEDGETCKKKRRDKGDGTFEEVKTCRPTYRDEPGYDDKCSYTVRRWKKSRSVDAQGTSVAPEPAWPTVQLTRTGTGLGAEREGKRTEVYRARLADKDGEEHECDVAFARFRQLTPGSRWTGDVRVVSGGLACDTLKPAR